MGSHTTQGIGLVVFLLAFVALSGYLAGYGMLFLLLFVVLLGASVAAFLKCKTMEEAAE